jgi:hypothetical protein
MIEFFYVTSFCNSIQLPLHRTLVLQQFHSSSNIRFRSFKGRVCVFAAPLPAQMYNCCPSFLQ